MRVSFLLSLKFALRQLRFQSQAPPQISEVEMAERHLFMKKPFLTFSTQLYLAEQLRFQSQAPPQISEVENGGDQFERP
jgi:hypothetical protein